MFKGSACGKLILMGEHFVVWGAPALAIPLRQLQCEVRLRPHSHPRYVAKVPRGGENLSVIEAMMPRALHAAADSLRLGISGQSFWIESTANFPVSRGFGSSAAFGIALTRALDAYRKEFSGENAEWTEIQKAASAVERIFHGRPSGIDSSVIFAERPIRFENGAIVREFSNQALDLIAVDGGQREGCASLVEGVAKFRETNASRWDDMLSQARAQVDAMEKALRTGAAGEAAELIKASHAILRELGLSTPDIEDLLPVALECGALAGKVSGAGGGGAVLLAAQAGAGKGVAGRLVEKGISVLAIETAEKGVA